MIYTIEGNVTYKDKHFIVIKTNGLSYQVFVTDFLYLKIKTDQNIKLFTYLEIRSDAIELYGFENIKERTYFKLLRSISGIGPKSSMNVLSLIHIKDLEQAIINEDILALTRVSGIGKKTAERVILELKGKIKATPDTQRVKKNDALVIDALTSMGYALPEAREAIKKIPEDIEQAEKRIKYALKILSGR
ncbi:Holliday junction branch migration protein RuvA [Patescibacteria group bacterium AH-259-L07]|nr:Holliday junction branch migration protein RuvA [Patescibacteria group bacterium AH-259-L07]